MSPTEEYIARLAALKEGELGLLRTHAGKGLDETIEGFDLFTGLWWPLRQKHPKAPRREVAWLVAKLHAFRPLAHCPDGTLALGLGKCRPRRDWEAAERFAERFDQMLSMPLWLMESRLQWALNVLAGRNMGVDWVRLTDDLSFWEHESKRLEWAEQYLGAAERRRT